MQSSKIPIRTTISTNSKSQVISNIQKENKSKNVPQRAKLLVKQGATTKQSNQIAKDKKETNTLKELAKDNNFQKKPAQEEGKQASQPHYKDKNTSKKMENAKQINNQVLKEQNKSRFIKSEKPNSWQQPKIVREKDFDLVLKNRKTPKPITIPQGQNASTSNANQKKSENHRSQPDIEFVPDENCLKRILSGRELSPAALKLPLRRAQSSHGGRFSNFNPPVPVDPFKTLLKALENVAPESRRSSVRKHYYPSSPLNNPNYCRTPKRASEIAMRRLTDIKFRQNLKSSKKVTFKLPDADVAQKISWQERKLEINQLRLTDISEKSAVSSQYSTTPELDEDVAKLLPSISDPAYGGQTPSITSFKDMLRDCPQFNIGKPDKKLTGILRSNTLTTITCDVRPESKINASNCMPRKLRRSMSASELESCPASKSSTLKSSKVPSERDLQKSNQVQSSVLSHPPSDVCNANTFKTTGCPELNDKLSSCNLNMQNSGVKTGSKNAAAFLVERRESAILAYKSRKHRRSVSASEINSISGQNILQDKSLKSHTGRESNHVHSSVESHQFATSRMLRTISSPELSDKFCNSKLSKCDPIVQDTGKKPSILKIRHQLNNDIAADSHESTILAYRSRKYRRSVSASKIDMVTNQDILKDKQLKSPSKIHTKRELHSTMASCQSINTCNSKMQLENGFFDAGASKQNSCASGMQGIRNTDNQPDVFRNIAAAADCDERRSSEIHSQLRSRYQRSMRTSELSCPSSISAQATLKAELPNRVDSVRLNKIGNSAVSHPSPDARDFLRTSSSFSNLVEKLSSNGLPRKTGNNNPLYSTNKNFNSKCNYLQLSSVRAAELRSSLYSSCRRNTIQSTCSPKLCTPCPVSLNPKSRAVKENFSPEFLCRRSSNIISHAPIRTPLVMRQLAEDELSDEDHHLSPVRQKLDFEPVHQKGKDDSKGISKAYLQTFKMQQKLVDCLADQECCIIMSYVDSFLYLPRRDLSNPIAKTLKHGDGMHFVPVV